MFQYFNVIYVCIPTVVRFLNKLVITKNYQPIATLSFHVFARI